MFKVLFFVDLLLHTKLIPKPILFPHQIVSKLFFRIRSSIDNPEYDIQRSNFEFWDQLIIY
jgi:hypothetical protein